MEKYFNTSGSYRELGLKDKFDSLTLEDARFTSKWWYAYQTPFVDQRR